MLNPKNLLIVFLLFVFFQVHSQENDTVLPLKKILENISIQHNIKFNYAEDEIIIFKIIPPSNAFSLVQQLDYIESKTTLKFKKIDAVFYSLYNDRKLDKPLCGYIIDSNTGLPVEHALVQFTNTNIQTQSDIKGYFELPISSSNDIKIKHLSYEDLFLSVQDIYKTNCPKFYLKSFPIELDEVLTERFLTSGITKKNEGNIIIKPKKFGILPGLIEPDVLQTMQQIPGIVSVDETISNLSVRGGTNDQNLFIWNGIRVFQTGHFFGLISAFNSSLAQNIKITKNGSSAFFGESVSSLVEISSQNNDTLPSHGSIGTNLISGDFYTKLKLSNKANIILSGRRSWTDIIETPTYNLYKQRIFQNTVITDLKTNAIQDYKSDVNFNFYDVTAQYEQKIGKKNQLNIETIAIENRLGFYQSTSVLSKNSDLEQENFGAILHWKTNWNSNHTSVLHASISCYDLNSVYESIVTNQILKQENKVLNNTINLQHYIVLSDKLGLNLGYQFDEIGVSNNDEINDPEFKRFNKEISLSHIAVAESAFSSLNKKTYFRIGSRFNYFQSFSKLIIEPRIHFNQKINSHINLEIQAEQKSQSLTQIIDLQRDFLGIEKRRWVLANENTLPILKSNQISIGASFKRNNWFINIDNFYKKVIGISSSSQGFQNQFEFQKSVGNYIVYGSEFFIQKTFSKFYTWLSYSINKNNYEFNSLYSNNFPNNYEIRHNINWAGIYEWKKIKLALGGKWHTGRPITTPVNTSVSNSNQTIVYNAPNDSKLKDYMQINLSISKKWTISSTTAIETSASILNLFNTKNSINRFYRINNTLNTIESVDTYSMGLTPNINVKMSF